MSKRDFPSFRLEGHDGVATQPSAEEENSMRTIATRVAVAKRVFSASEMDAAGHVLRRLDLKRTALVVWLAQVSVGAPAAGRSARKQSASRWSCQSEYGYVRSMVACLSAKCWWLSPTNMLGRSGRCWHTRSTTIRTPACSTRCINKATPSGQVSFHRQRDAVATGQTHPERT